MVLVQGTSGSPATAADCKKWRDKYGLAGMVSLYDSSNKMAVLWDNNTTALSVFVNADRVITGKLHTDVKSQIAAQIDKALGL